MLSKILSISGKSGLYKLQSQGKNMFIVESIETSKRLPVYARDQVIALGDIAMYTQTEEVPLRAILKTMLDLEKGSLASCKPKAKPEELKTYFGTILEDFDRDRVHPSDIKKLIQWYNLLVEHNLTDFDEKTSTDEAKEGTETTEENAPNTTTQNAEK